MNRFTAAWAMTQNTVLACLCAALLMSCTTPEPDTTDFVKCLENNLIEAFGTDAVQQQFDAYGQFIQFYYSDTEVIRLYAQLTDQYRLSGQTVAPDSLRKVIALRQKSLDYLKAFSAITDSTRLYWQKSVEYCQNEILYHNWIIDNRNLNPSDFQQQKLATQQQLKLSDLEEHVINLHRRLKIDMNKVMNTAFERRDGNCKALQRSLTQAEQGMLRKTMKNLLLINLVNRTGEGYRRLIMADMEYDK